MQSMSIKSPLQKTKINKLFRMYNHNNKVSLKLHFLLQWMGFSKTH